MEIGIILHQMLQFFIIMFLGYFLSKVKLVDHDFIKKLTKLLLNVTLPATIFSSVLEADSERDPGGVAQVFVIGVIVYAALPVISFVIVKLMRLPGRDRGLYAFMMTYSNIGFMGFPLMDALFGQKAVFYAAIVNVLFNISVFTCGVVMMNVGRADNLTGIQEPENYEAGAPEHLSEGMQVQESGQPKMKKNRMRRKSGVKKSAAQFKLKNLLSPGVSISVMSIVVYFMNIPFPQDIRAVVSSVGGITTPLAMILIGATLATMELKSIFSDWHVYFYSLVKQVFVPLLLWPVLKLCISDEFILSVIYILILMPVANTSVLFATEYGGDEKLAAKTVFITTVMSIVTVPLLLMICM